MLDKISTDIKEAMKEKNKPKVDALRYMKSMLIENKTSKKPIEEQDVVIKHYKKLQDSLENFPEDGDIYQKTVIEIEFIKAYMPEQMSEEDVINLVNDIYSSLDNPNIGSMMKELSPKIKGKFDGKRANEIVREKLG